MSGSGRKTHYRKSVTEEFLHGLPVPEPSEGELVVRARASRGTNIFEIELPNGDVELAMLPNKFRKLIWIKRGDYLIVAKAISRDGGESMTEDDLKVKFLIKHILQKEQISHINKVGLWPHEFELDPKLSKKGITKDDELMPNYDSGSDFEYDYEEEKLDSMGNTITKTTEELVDGS